MTKYVLFHVYFLFMGRCPTDSRHENRLKRPKGHSSLIDPLEPYATMENYIMDK